MRPSDVGTQTVNFAQISLWRKADWGVADGERGVNDAISMARECSARDIRTVYHPLEYPLTGEHAARTLDMMKRLAAESDLGIIIHDEGGGSGTRLMGAEAVQYREHVRAISRLCPVSIENSYNSKDITWFWERFVMPMPESVSITLDIGHLEGGGVDSISFISALQENLVQRIRFVHIHHHDEHAHGVKDHRPLVAGCREMEALGLLLKRKKDLWVIVELDAADVGMKTSIELLEQLRIADFGMRNEPQKNSSK